MILVISSLMQSQQGVEALQQALKEPVKTCPSLEQAIAELQAQEFSAVVFDQLLLNAAPDEGEAALKHVANALPVYVNFAITGSERVARELRSALQRRERELLAAKNQAERELRHELKEAVTALLLSCEMALRVPDLPQLAASRMQEVEALAREMSGKLGEVAA